MSEDWRAVPGFEGLYEVSRNGVVRSVERQIARGNTGVTLTYRSRCLKPRVYTKYGHLKVALYRDRQRFDRAVHQLVLEAFVGPRPAKMEGRHLNGRPADNRLDNLCWGTSRENKADAKRHGTIPSKLSPTAIAAIRRQLRNPYRGVNRDLALRYAVDASTISHIRRGAIHGN